jgi:hypothetical protein
VEGELLPQDFLEDAGLLESTFALAGSQQLVKHPQNIYDKIKPSPQTLILANSTNESEFSRAAAALADDKGADLVPAAFEAHGFLAFGESVRRKPLIRDSESAAVAALPASVVALGGKFGQFKEAAFAELLVELQGGESDCV